MADSGRELRIAVAPGATGFDPEQGGANGLFVRMCYARPLYYPPVKGPDGEMIGDVPNLAGGLLDRWEVSADGHTYRLTVRAGVQSQAGNALTAEDIRWSWDRAIALRDVGKWVAIVGSVTRAEDITVIDERTVDFRLRAPNPTFLQQLTRTTPAIHDSTEARRHATPEDSWAKTWLARNPAGFGSYRLESLNFWQEAVFVANPGGAVAPMIDRVRVRYVPGAERRRELLQAGEVDLLPFVEPSEVAELSAMSGVRVSRVRSGRHVALMMNCQIAPFDQPAVRQAVALAVPYDRILAEVYHGTARPWRSPIPETVTMSNDTFWEYRHDPAEARRRLAAAGFPDGFRTELFVDAADAEHLGCVDILAPALAEIGIRATVEKLDSAIFWQGARYFRPYPMLVYEDAHQVPDPYYALVHDYLPGKLGLINCGNYVNQEVAGLIQQVEGIADPTERQEVVDRAQAIIMADSPNAQLAQPAYIAALRDDVQGLIWPPDRSFPVELLHFR